MSKRLTTTFSAEELKALQQSNLDKLMSEKKLSASSLAKMIGGDEFEVDMNAMSIADARQGETILSYDTCIRIAGAMGIAVESLYPLESSVAGAPPVRNSADISVSEDSSVDKRVSRRKKVPATKQEAQDKSSGIESSPKEKAIRKKSTTAQQIMEAEASTDESVVEEASLQLSIADLQEFFGEMAISVIRTKSGRLRLRAEAEAPISKDYLLQLFFKMNKK